MGKELKLKKVLLLEGNLVAETGLRIGTGKASLTIGDIDMTTVKDPKTGLPYIPGSSIKGKLRSTITKMKKDLAPLKEYYESKGKSEAQLKELGWKKIQDIWIHDCSKTECEICTVYGSSAENNTRGPTRIKVFDAPAVGIWKDEKINQIHNPDELLEIKSENTLDVLTAHSVPRTVERVSAGTVFKFKLAFEVYNDEDEKLFTQYVIDPLKVILREGIGSSTSRGYGKLRLENVTIKEVIGKKGEGITEEIKKAVKLLEGE